MALLLIGILYCQCSKAPSWKDVFSPAQKIFPSFDWTYLESQWFVPHSHRVTNHWSSREILLVQHHLKMAWKTLNIYSNSHLLDPHRHWKIFSSWNLPRSMVVRNHGKYWLMTLDQTIPQKPHTELCLRKLIFCTLKKNAPSSALHLMGFRAISSLWGCNC